MPRYVFTEAAAGSAVGTIMNNGQRGQGGVGNRARRVNRLALVGSAAAGDSAVDLFYGDTFVGRFFNTATGTAPLEARDFQAVPPELAAEPGEFLNIAIADAGVTNALQCTVEVSEF